MSDVLATIVGRVGQVRLNRPKALNALNLAMCEGVLAALETWRDDPSVEILTIDHAQGRGFCAGGDIRMMAESAAHDGAAARAFFLSEYRMNNRLFTYPKETVAFMDGITMGGGVGIALPCRFRVATENTMFAMPETGIGLFPDVGGGWYLARLPGRIGQYLALTGHRLDGAECLALGLATHYIPSASLGAVKSALEATPHVVTTVLGASAQPAPEAAILARREMIDRLFAFDQLADIYTALEADDDDWAAETLATLKTKSPQALKVSLRLLAEGAAIASFTDEMKQEYAVGARVVQRPDFIEGVRALMVDKDNAPHWNPGRPEDVPDDLIDKIFAPLAEDEAWTPN